MNVRLSLGLLPLFLAGGVSAQRVAEAAEPNQTAATATALAIGREAFGSLAAVGDSDWYAITVPAGVRLRAETGPGAGAQARDCDWPSRNGIGILARIWRACRGAWRVFHDGSLAKSGG